MDGKAKSQNLQKMWDVINWTELLSSPKAMTDEDKAESHQLATKEKNIRKWDDILEASKRIT